jgi:hypothetical protein
MFANRIDVRWLMTFGLACFALALRQLVPAGFGR